MRIVTWNMGRNSGYQGVHDAAWHHLLDQGPRGLGADLALVQEAVVPSWLETGRALWVRAWDTKPWGTGIVAGQDALGSKVECEVEGGRFVLAQVDTDQGSSWSP